MRSKLEIIHTKMYLKKISITAPYYHATQMNGYVRGSVYTNENIVSRILNAIRPTQSPVGIRSDVTGKYISIPYKPH